MRVTDLTFQHVDRLRTRLDVLSSSSIPGWEHLADVIALRDNNLRERVKALSLHHHGGGNPALEFLKDLPRRVSSVTLADLQAIAKELRRNDIVQFIEENLYHEKHKDLLDVSTWEKERLSNYMNKSIPGVHGWEMFASKYNYKYTEIKSLKATIAAPCSFSPTTKLIELLQESMPDMTVGYLHAKCVEIGRNDVASIMKEILDGKF